MKRQKFQCWFIISPPHTNLVIRGTANDDWIGKSVVPLSGQLLPDRYPEPYSVIYHIYYIRVQAVATTGIITSLIAIPWLN